jgi:hypothetical protein
MAIKMGIRVLTGQQSGQIIRLERMLRLASIEKNKNPELQQIMQAIANIQLSADSAGVAAGTVAQISEQKQEGEKQVRFSGRSRSYIKAMIRSAYDYGSTILTTIPKTRLEKLE